MIAARQYRAALAAKLQPDDPLRFCVAEDPVKLVIVASLARPGGNATGINFYSNELTAKRLGLMHELVPRLFVGRACQSGRC